MREEIKNEKYPTEEFKEEDPLKEDGEKKEVERSLGGMCLYGLSNVTVEPVMALFVLSVILTMVTTQNLGLEKACRVNLNFSKEICNSLKMQQVESQNSYEKETQQLVAKLLSYRVYVTATVPCIIALLSGSYSDKSGRKKVFLMIPIIGQILLCISNIINVYFFDQLGLEVVILSEAILEGFSGGWCLIFFIMFAYISVITSPETRTFRMGMLNFSMTVGFPIGMGLSGIFLKTFGYYGCYGVSACLHMINLSYIVFLLRDPVRSSEQKQHDNRGVRHFCRTYFDLSNMKETVQVVFKNGPNNRRLRICIMMLVVSILFGPIFGEVSILYLSTRFRFNWDEVRFSLFQTYNFVTHTIGTIFSITVFSKYLQWHDSILGIISTVSKIAGSFFYCFAPNEKIFFIAPLVEILNGTSLLAMRSIVSKLVAPNELGKVNSIFGLTENLMPLVYVPLYTNVYKATMDVLPGAVFLMGAAMTLPAVVVFFWLLYEHRKETRRLRRHEEAEINETPLKESLLKPN